MVGNWIRDVFHSQYREATPVAIATGFIIGSLMTASFTYAGMVLGFSLGGSAVAAIIGWGILRAVFKKGTIVENNIVQTIASAINNGHSGVIFTIPVLFLRGVGFNPVLILAACIAGAILGVAFIIPVRKQMIDFERLRFPTGTAVGAILKSPGVGVKKARLLLYGFVASAFVYLLTQLPLLGLPQLIPDTVNIGRLFHLPGYVVSTMAVSLFSFGAGFITGRIGLVVLAGGVVAYWIITPLARYFAWIPPDLTGAQVAEYAHNYMNRPLGIGMLIGGALMGIVLSAGSIKAAIASLRRMEVGEKSPEELPLSILVAAVAVAFGLLTLASYFTSQVGLLRALLTALVGVVWLLFAGIIVAECTGMTDWSPISGMALVAVLLMLFLNRGEVVTAVVIGATVCVAITQCADMMQDLKTGYLVGAVPIRQQFLEMSTAWIGTIISLATIFLLWKAYGFGPGHRIAAPQAQALNAAIDGILGGATPWGKYLIGGLVGVALSGSGIPGLGVLIGISMYIPLLYILPYGLGCVANVVVSRFKGKAWTEEWCVPPAAGFIAGETTLVLVFAILTVIGVIG